MSDPSSLETYVRDELPRIVKVLQASRVRELEIESDSGRLVIHRARAASVAMPVAGLNGDASGEPEGEIGPHVRTVTAPIVGVFYHAEQPDHAPLVEVGSHVDKGSMIGVIEALQVQTEVESDAEGTVHRVVAADGESVEFGQPLVEVLVGS